MWPRFHLGLKVVGLDLSLTRFCTAEMKQVMHKLCVKAGFNCEINTNEYVYMFVLLFAGVYLTKSYLL